LPNWWPTVAGTANDNLHQKAHWYSPKNLQNIENEITCIEIDKKIMNFYRGVLFHGIDQIHMTMKL